MTGTTTADNSIKCIDALFKTIPMTIPLSDVGRESAFTCRVWVKQAVIVLAENGIVKCLDVDALEREIIEFGNENEPNVLKGLPYKLHFSSHST